MIYYKIIKYGQIIGVGYTFLKWNKRRNAYNYCDVDDAECVHDEIKEGLYHADWLRDIPDKATPCTEATVEKITAEEYEELYALLIDGEEVPVPVEPDDPEPTPEPDPEPEPEKPMTIPEMRDNIRTLISKVLTEDKPFIAETTYQIDDIITNGSLFYVATQVIIAGETIRNGINCKEIKIADVINTIQNKQEA